MGLTIKSTEQLECINCREQPVSLKKLQGKRVRKSKRGRFRANFICPNCEAQMSLVYFDNNHKFGWAVAYSCTENDEPCYRETCSRCAGNGIESIWWLD